MYLTLKILAGKHVGKELRISKPVFVVGRADDCQLRPTSGEVSRYHCEISARDRVVNIRDLGSTNGTYVNGVRVSEPKQLRTGDVLIVGPLMFEVRLPLGSSPPPMESEPSEWAIGDEEGVDLVTEDASTADSGATRLVRGDQFREMLSRHQEAEDLGGASPRRPDQKDTARLKGDTKNMTPDGQPRGPAAPGAAPATPAPATTPVKPLAASPLTNDLVKLLEEHKRRLPSFTWRDAQSALQQALLIVEQKITDGK